MAHGVLFLTLRMSQGYGVDLVVDRLRRGIEAQGRRAAVGCLMSDGFYGFGDFRLVDPTPTAIARCARYLDCDTIVAHTSPYFEALPELSQEFTTWAWDHGDPTPSLFDESERHAREAVRRRKIETVYPRLSGGVIAISEFIRRDIEWPAARIVYSGCDHVDDPGRPEALGPYPKLRVRGLTRFGRGEARYKGFEAFEELAKRLDAERFEVEIMGRGSAADAARLERAGLRVHRNASDLARAEFLTGADAFVSWSAWEGFNLPLVEAQASGAAALARRAGAHPEVCPLNFDTLDEVVATLERWSAHPAELLAARRAAYDHVRKRFTWAHTCERAIAELKLEPGSPVPRPSTLIQATTWLSHPGSLARLLRDQATRFLT